MLKIRMRRMGTKHRPFYRVVVSDSRKTPRGAFVDSVGHFDPKAKPPVVSLDVERMRHWIDQGAQCSDRVRQLLKAEIRRQKGEEATPEQLDAAAAAAAEAESEAPASEGEGAAKEGAGEHSAEEEKPDAGGPSPD